jgi:hypothetical protein
MEVIVTRSVLVIPLLESSSLGDAVTLRSFLNYDGIRHLSTFNRDWSKLIRVNT